MKNQVTRRLFEYRNFSQIEALFSKNNAELEKKSIFELSPKSKYHTCKYSKEEKEIQGENQKQRKGG